jgi:8-oxo-dGTP pyrophosphatase MutT (NUDIX family)
MVKLLKQFAALPVMETGGTPHVLLITSRATQRWIIPKGRPEKRMLPSAVAALEAREEAGVAGTSAKDRLGDIAHKSAYPQANWCPAKSLYSGSTCQSTLPNGKSIWSER